MFINLSEQWQKKKYHTALILIIIIAAKITTAVLVSAAAALKVFTFLRRPEAFLDFQSKIIYLKILQEKQNLK